MIKGSGMNIEKTNFLTSDVPLKDLENNDSLTITNGQGLHFTVLPAGIGHPGGKINIRQRA